MAPSCRRATPAAQRGAARSSGLAHVDRQVDQAVGVAHPAQKRTRGAKGEGLQAQSMHAAAVVDERGKQPQVPGRAARHSRTHAGAAWRYRAGSVPSLSGSCAAAAAGRPCSSQQGDAVWVYCANSLVVIPRDQLHKGLGQLDAGLRSGG